MSENGRIGDREKGRRENRGREKRQVAPKK
jgi:hypothetical protein